MEQKTSTEKIKIWGGIECTINRVEDRYFDQLEYTGHYSREGDIKEIVSLGIKMLRYPILWERHVSADKQPINWNSTTKRLEEIRKHKITIIAGLIHHGSGPAFTNLLNPAFPEEFARYAGEVAERFPWIEYYTPVNEPLTTARFSGLYGFWYPHHRNDISFARILLNQVKAVVLAMRAIRKINPSAKLVQTEDLSKTYSTPKLNFQAKFENERRWLTYDLLCGKVTPEHMMWKYFVRLGIPATDLLFFLENRCVPDIAGMNYYITSERFLDERIEKYPSYTHGGNELIEYADVEAVRVSHKQPWGLKVLLKEAWERFSLPLAITECQLNCTRDEQLRWFMKTYNEVGELRDEGVNINAVTAWSMLGCYGWDKLLTSPDMKYEAGVFDTRSGQLRYTALAQLIEALNSNKPLNDIAQQPGWWYKNSSCLVNNQHIKPLLLIGSTGTLGTAFIKICGQRSLKVVPLTRKDLDITSATQIENILLEYKPWAVINTAGYVRVDDAETDEASCYAANTAAPVLLATACNKHNVRFMSFSSDLVFDGLKADGYIESDQTNPLNVYGKSKAMAENQVFFVNDRALIIRTSAFFGPWDRYNFAWDVIEKLKNNRRFRVPADVFISPTYVPHLVDHALDILIDDMYGIWHLSNNGKTTWAQFARSIAVKAGFDDSLIEEVSIADLTYKARRPQNSVLSTEKGQLLPDLDIALDQFISHLRKDEQRITV